MSASEANGLSQSMNDNSAYIGLDLSTQQLKAIVIDDNLKVLHHVSVAFDEELSEYRTSGGACKPQQNDPNTILAPVNMWLKALDLCLDKLNLDGLDFNTVKAISGSAQQHGSVWWKEGSELLLKNPNYDDFLHTQLVSAFSLRNSPIWMDSSTTKECQAIESHIGGPLLLAELTGSRAYERFTAAQIVKIIVQRPEVFQQTERITLISNFLTSLFVGSYAAFDASDASGMNLMNLQTKQWSSEALEAVACCGNNNGVKLIEQLKTKLCYPKNISESIVDTCNVVGRISNYFVERHGFSGECQVCCFTGDNPASFAGFCLDKNELLLSLGTSDTAIFSLDKPIATLNGHILRNPIDPNAYMGLICFKNGSKTRERIRDKCAPGTDDKDWTQFSRMLDKIPRGNFGNLGFYYDFREIYPLCVGDYRFNKLDQRVESFSNEIEVRACIEGQFLRLLHHCRQMGLKLDVVDRVLVTGGASANKSILSVISEIFQKPVYTLDMPNSACLGAAYMARYSSVMNSEGKTTLTTKPKNFKQVLSHNGDAIFNSPQAKLAVDYIPTIVTSNVYDSLLERYVRLEESLSCK